MIIIDLGNTYSKIAWYDYFGKKIVKKINIKTKDLIKKKHLNKLKNNFKSDYCLISSVVPSSFRIIKNFFNKINVRVFELSNTKLIKNIEIKINNKKKVGSDRVANAIGVVKLGYKNAIVVDFGTATTFDILVNSIYIGGIIAPGLDLSIKSLHHLTSQLPLIKLKQTNKIIGKNTFEAINSGIYYGYISLINGIVKQIKLQTKKKFKIILTGGTGKIFQGKLKFKSEYIEDITLTGLIEIIHTNKKQFNVN